MKESEIRKYAELMREFGLTGLEISEDSKALRLERAAASAGEATDTYRPIPSPAERSDTEADYISIKSPIVGVFYTAPAENTEPYVAVGDHVKKGQTLCIVEAMKLMNEIVAEDDGVISEVCAANGQVVEFGTELFRIKR